MNKTGKIQAVVFDVDGTLYPNIKMYITSLLFFLLHPKISLSFRKIRKIIRHYEHIDRFHEKQAQLLADELKIDFNRAEELLDKYIYGQFVSMFSWIKPYPVLESILKDFRRRNIKIGIISDFPVDKKLSYLGLDKYWDIVLSADKLGALKPREDAFKAMAEQLNMPPEEIIYVGNHYLYDIIGASGSGMLSAHFSSIKAKNSVADLTFRDYRKLQDFVLNYRNS